MNQDKSSADIERDIHRTRQHADMVLTELEERLSPDRLIQDARHFFTESPTGREMVENMKASVVRNPVPLLLTMVGIGWMMLEGMRARRPLHAEHRMGMRQRLGRSQTLDSHHMHVEDSGSAASPGRGPGADEIIGTGRSGRSAAESAEAFKGNGGGQAGGPVERDVPSVLGPDGQPIEQTQRGQSMH